jgi:DNA processing protein
VNGSAPGPAFDEPPVGATDAGADGTRPWWADLGARLSAGGADPIALRAWRPPVSLQAGEAARRAGRPKTAAPLPLPGLGHATGPERVATPSLPPLPDAAWIAALLLLPDVGPTRLLHLLGAFGAPGAWARVLDGSVLDRPDLAGALGGRSWPAMVAGWQRTARTLDVAGFWEQHVDAQVGVTTHGGAAYPRCLVDDPEPPAALFHWGDPTVIVGPRVAIVGTRRCSERGRRLAEQMGFELGRAGVSVVSGLALGIDGAAHKGALRAAERGGAPPIGVVASGLDVVYPERHRRLWRAVAEAGVLMTEVPLGVPPNRWRFPAPNRVLAGLADVVVVVESPETGGSMHTVDEAARRDVPVLAVPGAVGLRVGAGTNRLIREGAGVALDTDDVLVALGLLGAARVIAAEDRPSPGPVALEVLDALGWRPASLAELVDRVHASPAAVVEAVVSLGRDGWLAASGGWLERVAR